MERARSAASTRVVYQGSPSSRPFPPCLAEKSAPGLLNQQQPMETFAPTQGLMPGRRSIILPKKTDGLLLS